MKIYRLVVALIFLSMTNCKSDIDLDVQGHRGARGLMPENTLPAFEKAIELGVTTLELDVVISKDRKVVVSHEPFMNHVICRDSQGNDILESDEMDFNLYKMDYDSIRKFDCGLKAHPRFPEQLKIAAYKPLLSEVIKMAEAKSEGKIKYNIEVKSDPTYDDIYSPNIRDFVSMVIRVITEKGIEDRVTLQSFDLRTLEEIHYQKPNTITAILVDETENIDLKLSALSYKPEIISPYFKLLDKKNVADYKAEGYMVIPWTINQMVDMEKMISLKVDGIITDYPDRLIEMISSK